MNIKHLLQGQLINGSFGNYEVIKQIGRGAISVVYQGFRVEDNYSVAIKKVDSTTIMQRQNIYQKNEIDISKKISDIKSDYLINIIEVVEYDKESSLIVMEFCDGCDLYNFSMTFFINWHVAIEFGYQIACGINDLHKFNITHRDLKPENIFVKSVQSKSNPLQGDYFLKIGDFGLSKEGEIYQSQVGTPNYMCPEQFRTGDKSKETDIFAFGLIFFELFEKRQYFSANDVEGITSQILNYQAYDRSKLTKIDNNYIKQKINDLIEKCLPLKPKERISSKNLVEELKQLVEEAKDIPENQLEIYLKVSPDTYFEKNKKKSYNSIFFLISPEEDKELKEKDEKQYLFLQNQNIISNEYLHIYHAYFFLILEETIE